MNGDGHIRVCALQRPWQILGGQFAASAQQSWLLSSDYHLFGPLKAIMTVTGTAQCHAPICHKGGRARFTRHEHVLCFTRGRRLLTSVETRLKNNFASSTIIVKVCEMVACPTCIQHAWKGMRHWFLTASSIFQNDVHVFNLYNIFFKFVLCIFNISHFIVQLMHSVM
jgi:hypothetical protein